MTKDNIFDNNYHDLIKDVLENGSDKSDRTGTGTRSLFGRQIRYNLKKGFPLITTKKIHFKSVVHELLWFLSGSTNIKYLNDNGVRIWNEWADENGELGPVYGKQWRAWESKDEEIDQIKELIEQLKNNPDSRRLIVSAWNVGQVKKMALPPCHTMFQFYTKEINLNGVIKRELSCMLYQRSNDLFLGCPFNIASYALLIEIICHSLDMIPGEFIHTIGDAHIYLNHFDQCKLQLSRESFKAPTIKFNCEPKSIFDYKFEDIELINYKSHELIKAKVAV